MPASPPPIAAMEIIRSRQNPLAKQLIKLAENRRERLKLQQTVLLGTHLIQAAQDANWQLLRIVACEGHEERPEIAALLATGVCPATTLAAELFAEVEQAPSCAGIMALATMPSQPPPRTQGCCLLLDGVQDPGNVGSILRTAVAAGVDQVWLTPGCADVWSPKVLRAGMGAHFAASLIERIDLDGALAAFQGPLLVTSLDDSSSLYDCDLRGDLILALGSEGAGVSPALQARAERRIRIPMAGSVESLNVAAAAAICLFERLRQRLT